MGFRIQTALPVYTMQKHLERTSNQLEDTFGRLSSGLRIYDASDDLASTGLSRRMSVRLRAEGSVQRNIEAGLAMVRTGMSGLSEIHGALSRMKELAVQAANASLSSDDRAVLDTEFQGLYEEIERIAALEVNGNAVLAGNTYQFQIGTDSNNQVSMTFADALQWNVSQIGSLGVNLNGVSQAVDANVRTQNALNWITSREGIMGSYEVALESALSRSQTRRENLSTSQSKIADVDIAAEYAEMARLQVKQQFGTALLAQGNFDTRAVFDVLFSQSL